MNTEDSKLPAIEDLFSKIFAMTNCKVLAENYVTSYGNKFKDIIWEYFLML